MTEQRRLGGGGHPDRWTHLRRLATGPSPAGRLPPNHLSMTAGDGGPPRRPRRPRRGARQRPRLASGGAGGEAAVPWPPADARPGSQPSHSRSSVSRSSLPAGEYDVAARRTIGCVASTPNVPHPHPEVPVVRGAHGPTGDLEKASIGPGPSSGTTRILHRCTHSQPGTEASIRRLPRRMLADRPERAATRRLG